ncbi:MFS transporter [Streptomyces sp. NPDC004134]|uniref:MFS transporter n=1 Tax=Streptomyces sp. NPDC004134 TaxID=3364691 RepID=UPI0036C64D2B
MPTDNPPPTPAADDRTAPSGAAGPAPAADGKTAAPAARRRAPGTTGSNTGATPVRFTGRARLVLLVLCASQFMVALDFSILNVALPELGADLGLGQAILQWAVTAFALPTGGFLLLFGRIGDLFGRRRLFLTGLVVFTVSSVLATFAWDAASFLAGRALQGLGAAALVPTGMALLTTGFPEGPQRSRALSIMGSIMALGFTAGMLLGGVLTEAFGWRSTMAVLSVAGAAVLAVAPGVLTESRPDRRPRLDVPGAVTVTGGLLAVIYALSTAAEHGFGRPDVPLTLVAGATLLAAFGVIESRTAEPLVSLPLLRRPTVAWGALGGFATYSMMSSFIFLGTLYLQQIRGVSALGTGLVFGLLGLTAALGGTVAPRLVARWGAHRTLQAGLLVQGLTTAPVVFVGESPAGVWLVTVCGAVAGFCHLCAVVAYGLTVTSGVPDEQQGLATGIVTSAQQIAMTTGIPLLSALAASRGGLLDGLRLGLAADAAVLVAVALLTTAGLRGGTRRAA